MVDPSNLTGLKDLSALTVRMISSNLTGLKDLSGLNVRIIFLNLTGREDLSGLIRRIVRLPKIVSHKFPVYEIPKDLHVFGAGVAIVNVVSMFPNVTSQ